MQCKLPLSVVGGWRIVGFLGKGGMAPVYRVARDGHPDAAAKIMRLGTEATWKARELFERSAAILADLDHPGLPKLYDFEADDEGTLVLVRELFEGDTLAQRVTRSHWHPDAAQTTALLRTVLQLLQYLHDRPRPIVHRDIKPSNVMFRGKQPVLVDFDSVAGTERTSSTTIIVSPGYTAPEQLAGVVSPSADLYSVGATLLFVVSGREPYEFERDARGKLELTRALRSCPRPLARTIEGLLEPDPTRRISSAADALASLTATSTALATRVSASPPAKPRDVATNDATKARWFAVVAGAGALVVAGVVVAMVGSLSSEPAPDTGGPTIAAQAPPLPVAPSPVPGSPPTPPTPAVAAPACPPCPASHGCLGTTCVPEVTALAAGRGVQCRILFDDRLQCSASHNTYGQTGDGSDETEGWVHPRDLGPVRLAAAGAQQVCAVDTTDALWCWGDNRYGLVPDNPGKTIPVPTPNRAPGTISQIAIGWDRPYLVTDDHGLWTQLSDRGAWGRALVGKSIVAVAAENFLVTALDAEGSVWTWTHAPKNVERVQPLPTIVEIDVGREHACARDDTGAVWCWGANDKGQCGATDPRHQATPVRVALDEPAVEIDATDSLSCARLGEGAVVCWGEIRNQTEPTPQPIEITRAVAIATIADGVCVIGEDRLEHCVAIDRLQRAKLPPQTRG